jgi:uncharacterized membrane protein YhaH (DUF805 family)
MTPRALARFWWTFDEPVNASAYRRHGLGLTAVKFAGDAALVFAATGQVWTPLDYPHSLATLFSTTWSAAPAWLVPALAVWTLPFLWAGITLTVRRSVDSGWPAWYAFAFFVPYLNYALIVVLCLRRTRTAGVAAIGQPRLASSFARHASTAIAGGVAIGMAMIVLALPLSQHYGLALLFLTPFLMGAITGFLLNRDYHADGFETIWATLGTFALTGFATFATATDGAICILMAMPVVVPIGFFGAQCGREIARSNRRDPKPVLFAVVMLPLALTLEPAGAAGRILHEVRSAVDIAASPDVVWRHMIAFRPIAEPRDLVFRSGIAYPRSAHIEGAGVGAVRYCVFSTGAFVEPITGWEPGRRLTFDVTQAPPPLRELSIYSNVAPPHLNGYLRPRRGEFRLVKLDDGLTRLEGSTWYEIEMAPEGYWQLWSDYLIARIHRRVLDHIKRESES